MRLIADIVQIYRNYPALKTEVLVASVRHPIHLVQAAKLGAHVATLPPGVIRQLLKHPLTDSGLAAFLADWKKTGQMHPVSRARPHADPSTRWPEAVAAFLVATPGLPGATGRSCTAR